MIELRAHGNTKSLADCQLDFKPADLVLQQREGVCRVHDHRAENLVSCTKSGQVTLVCFDHGGCPMALQYRQSCTFDRGDWQPHVPKGTSSAWLSKMKLLCSWRLIIWRYNLDDFRCRTRIACTLLGTCDSDNVSAQESGGSQDADVLHHTTAAITGTALTLRQS